MQIAFFGSFSISSSGSERIFKLILTDTRQILKILRFDAKLRFNVRSNSRQNIMILTCVVVFFFLLLFLLLFVCFADFFESLFGLLRKEICFLYDLLSDFFHDLIVFLAFRNERYSAREKLRHPVSRSFHILLNCSLNASFWRK